MKEGDDKNLFVLTYDAAMEYSPSFRKFIELHPEVGSSMKILFKQNKSLSRHAGGVIVADDVAKQMPLIMSGGEPQSPWCEGMNVKELEKIAQWIKIDLLGLSTMRLIENSISLILENNFVNVCIDGIDYKLNKDDKVKLTNGQYVFVRELKISDDVVIPIETM